MKAFNYQVVLKNSKFGVQEAPHYNEEILMEEYIKI